MMSGFLFSSRQRPWYRLLFFFSSRRRHTRWNCDWSSDECSSDLMELLLITIVALWALLFLRRKFSIQTFASCIAGFLIGYAPAIWWNLTHSLRNWHFLFFEKPEAGGLTARFRLQACHEIFLH